MQSDKLRKQHIQSFGKLSLTERLSWAFRQNKFLAQFRDAKAKRLNKAIRRNGKKYFESSDLA
jgi:hypothetical protein